MEGRSGKLRNKINNVMLTGIKVFFIKLFQTPSYILTTQNGVVKVKHGRVSNSLINDCREVLRSANVTNGLIYATSGPGGKIIKGNIPGDILQQLRNVLQFHK
jgi:hypothetical protein